MLRQRVTQNPVIAEPTAPQPEQGVAFAPYGSRPGMTVQIVDRWGIGSERAVLFIRHTHQDAVDFCTGYEGPIASVHKGRTCSST